MTDLYAKMIESEQAAVAAIEALGNSIKEHMNASAAYAENPTDETWQAFVQAVDWRMKTHYVWGSTEGVNHEHCRFDKRDHSQ